MAGVCEISIIGPGRVGAAVGALAARAGWPVVAVAGGRPGRAEAACDVIVREAGRRPRALPAREAAAAGGLVLLTVPDGAIASVCDELAEAGAFGEGAVVAHCSGALGSDVLGSARRRCGCAAGSMHPLQTFPTVDSAKAHLPGTYCFCEGDDRAVDVLERLAAAIGGRPVRIDPAAKALYHAAAVVSCNYVVAMLDAGAALARRAGVPPATWLAAAEPMLRATMDNVAALGPERSLTGPIARGDVATIRRHAEAMRGGDEDVWRLYAAVGRWTLALARRAGTLDAAAAAALAELLGPDGPPA